MLAGNLAPQNLFGLIGDLAVRCRLVQADVHLIFVTTRLLLLFRSRQLVWLILINWLLALKEFWQRGGDLWRYLRLSCIGSGLRRPQRTHRTLILVAFANSGLRDYTLIKQASELVLHEADPVLVILVHRLVVCLQHTLDLAFKILVLSAEVIVEVDELFVHLR